MRSSAGTAAAAASGDTADADRRAISRGRARPRVAAAAALALLLAACATYAPAPIDPARTRDAFAARRLDEPALREEVGRVLPRAAETWPPLKWDRADLLAVALARNGTLAVARAEVEAALAGEVAATEKPNPTLGLQSEYARREPQHWLYGISFAFVARQRGVAALDADFARLGTAGARAALTEKTWSVRHALIGALSDRESARRRLDVLTRLASAEDALVEALQQRVAAGEDAPADLYTARAARIEIEQQQAEARADAVAADAATAAALGMPRAALDGIAIEWPGWGDPPPVSEDRLQPMREEALLSRADLAASISDYAQAENRVERAVARQYPQIEFRPGYYWDHGIAKWPFEVDFALPLFNRNGGEIAAATAARSVAGQRMLALQAGIYGEIDAAVRAEDVARANADAARRRNDAARVQLERADAALRLGAGDRLERASAEVLLLRAELDGVRARAQRQAARNALEDALHAPLSGPELALAKPDSAADTGAQR